MNVSLYQAASALDANSRWQDLIANNLAASSVPGFKKQELSIAAAEAGLIPSNAAARGAGGSRFVLPHATAHTSFAPGEMKYTGVSTDLAIQGSAFFEVQLPNGSLAYTRDGEFQMDAQGRLVTKQGYLVMSTGGPIQLDPRNGGALTVSADGQISQGGDAKGIIRLAQFNDPASLTQISGAYFTANNPNLIASQAAGARLRQGYLEGSNASSIAEMANLITAMRSFEANQRVIQTQDDRMGQAIQQLGSPA